MYGNCECGGKRAPSGADIICKECGKITPGVVLPGWDLDLHKIEVI